MYKKNNPNHPDPHPSKLLFGDASPTFPAMARSQRRRGANGGGFESGELE